MPSVQTSLCYPIRESDPFYFLRCFMKKKFEEISVEMRATGHCTCQIAENCGG